MHGGADIVISRTKAVIRGLKWLMPVSTTPTPEKHRDHPSNARDKNKVVSGPPPMSGSYSIQQPVKNNEVALKTTRSLHLADPWPSCQSP